jgi:hypothetical protein
MAVDRKTIATDLTEFGNEEARLHVEEMYLIGQLAKNRQARRALARRRCKMLREVACHPDAGLDVDTLAKANEPKDD